MEKWCHLVRYLKWSSYEVIVLILDPVVSPCFLRIRFKFLLDIMQQAVHFDTGDHSTLSQLGSKNPSKFSWIGSCAARHSYHSIMRTVHLKPIIFPLCLLCLMNHQPKIICCFITSGLGEEIRIRLYSMLTIRFMDVLLNNAF